ncbi:MAG: hypothetical protein JWN04_4379, partial [Myxococcaceae bacterium]|nr:hypothetical protein [Myxococcaceae bacterium]
MTLSMEEFRELLVDYLYGQLEGERLRAFEACLLESRSEERRGGKECLLTCRGGG